MEVESAKWTASAVLLTVTFIFTMMPLVILKKIQSVSENSRGSICMRIVSLFSCAGGGVFLGTSLLHLFPDVKEKMTDVFEQLNWDPSFPVAEFLLAFGFLVVLVAEQIVLTCQQHGEESEEDLPFLSHSHPHSAEANVRQTESYGSIVPYIPVDYEISFHEDPNSHSSLRSALLVLALSLHSVFEGLAIGLQSSTENVIRIFAAVMIHKCVIAFTLGLNLMHSKFKVWSIIKSNLFFSLMSPMGIICGTLISDFSQGLSLSLTSGILQGIAAGTFVYVTFFEVLPHELNAKEDKMWKVACLILGFAAVSFLVLYFPN